MGVVVGVALGVMVGIAVCVLSGVLIVHFNTPLNVSPPSLQVMTHELKEGGSVTAVTNDNR